jgi:hypothetical protein
MDATEVSGLPRGKNADAGATSVRKATRIAKGERFFMARRTFMV